MNNPIAAKKQMHCMHYDKFLVVIYNLLQFIQIVIDR